MASALADGHPLDLEVGPHPVLSVNLNQCIAAQKGDGHVVFTLRRQSDERVAMLNALGGLYARGVEVDFANAKLHPSGGAPGVSADVSLAARAGCTGVDAPALGGGWAPQAMPGPATRSWGPASAPPIGRRRATGSSG